MVVSLQMSLHYQVTWTLFSSKVKLNLVRHVVYVFVRLVVVNHNVAEWTSHIEYSGAKKVVPGRIYSMSIHPRSDKLMVLLSLLLLPRWLQETKMVIWVFGVYL